MLLLRIIFFAVYAVGPKRGNSFFHLAVLRAKASMLEATGTCFFSMRDHPYPATAGAADGIGGFRKCPSPSLMLRQGHLLKEIALLVSLMHDEPESALINGIFDGMPCALALTACDGKTAAAFLQTHVSFLIAFGSLQINNSCLLGYKPDCVLAGAAGTSESVNSILLIHGFDLLVS